MTRLLLAVTFATTAPLFAQPPDIPTPKTFPPDAATRKKIEDQTAELRKFVTKDSSPDVAVYLKAAEWIVRHEEWFTEKSAQQTLDVLAAGLKRAADKQESWLKVRGKPIIRGYRSTVDGSVQPFSVRYPDDFDSKMKYRADVILHGRDATLTEVKFIHAKETAKPGKPLDHFEVEVYGRGNNAYRWAGETDVFEVIIAILDAEGADVHKCILRGFSMGGAGTWHVGLHYPSQFAVLGPGAGFTTTRDYIGKVKFGPQPDYIEKCLHIYDAVDYAENVFNVPVVAYSGEKDKQKLAADLIGAKLKDFKEPHSFTHLVAPGLEHKQPPEWMEKLEAEYQKRLNSPWKQADERVRFVTYTTRYARTKDVIVNGLDAHYRKAVVDVRHKAGKIAIATDNVRSLIVNTGFLDQPEIVLDGDQLSPLDRGTRRSLLGVEYGFEKRNGKWRQADIALITTTISKRPDVMGPIDDAFRHRFTVVSATEKPWHMNADMFTSARRSEFEKNWDKYFRGQLAKKSGTLITRGRYSDGHWILFGDPSSNPKIALVLPKLPIKWTKDELVVNGVKYDPATHVPVLIYPYRDRGGSYVVINSGHTFREADLKGTNALLYPRLGDWAVLKPKPTKDDPAGFEVVAAGLFDENWQFEKK